MHSPSMVELIGKWSSYSTLNVYKRFTYMVFDWGQRGRVDRSLSFVRLHLIETINVEELKMIKNTSNESTS